MEEQFPVPRYTAASKIGNRVISLPRQLRCRCNPVHNKFSSLSNTTVVAIFPKFCLWRRSLCSNLGGIDLEKLYRATLMEYFTCSKVTLIPFLTFRSYKKGNHILTPQSYNLIKTIYRFLYISENGTL